MSKHENPTPESISEKFYTELWYQLRYNQSTAFLLTWLRKERRAKGKDFSQATPEELLTLLAGRNHKLRLDAESRAWLCGLGERAGGTLEGWDAGHPPKGRKAYRALLRAFAGHPDALAPDELSRLRETVLDASVRQEAWEFLFNAGFDRPKAQEDPDLETTEPDVWAEKAMQAGLAAENPTRRKNPRREDRVLRMLEDWCAETGHTLRRGGMPDAGQAGAGTREDWQQMLLALQRMREPADLLLPVRIDPATGTGLYLVSLGQFQNEGLKKQIREETGIPVNCVFVCFGLDEFRDETETFQGGAGDKITAGASVVLSPLSSPAAQGELPYCVTLEDGEAQLSYLLRREELAYQAFRLNNASAPPGTPDALKVYFSDPARKEEPETWETLAAEGRRESEREQAAKKKRPSTRLSRA